MENTEVKYTGQHVKELESIKEAANQFLPAGAFIAGGALTSAFTNQPIKDVDIYFKTEKDFVEAVQYAYEDMLWCVAASDRAVTFVGNHGKVIQLMHFDYFADAQAIFEAFDYTVSMAAYDIDKKEFVFHDDFMKHAAQRYLKFHSGTRYPYGSLMRVLKYQQRGYTIGKSDLLRIGLSCSKVPLNSWDDLARAIGGQYGEKAKIDETAPFSIDAALDLYKDTEITVADKDTMPGDAYNLLTKIGFSEDVLKAYEIEEPRKWGYW